MENLKTEITPIFNYKGKKLKPNETAPIHIKIYRSRVSSYPIRKFLPVGFEVTEKEWDKSSNNVSYKCSNFLKINKLLRDIVSYINDFELNLINKGQIMTQEVLEEFLDKRRGDEDDFLVFFKNEIDPRLKRGTKKEHNYTYNILIDYKKRIRFDEINLSFVQDFDNFLHSKGYMQNTIHKHHQHINRFLKLAAQKDKFNDNKNPYKHFKSQKVRSNRINLSPSEVKNIEELVIDQDKYPDLEFIRDLFLFSCYTGLRFSDVDTLLNEHVIEGKDGLFIQKKMEKVPKPIILPLDLLFEGKPRKIITKYLTSVKDGKVFPPISNQFCNRQLKVLANEAKISMNLTFHISRHTFGSFLADLTQNPYLIMDLMGHSDIKTSMIYIHRSQERINKQLRFVNWQF